MQFLKSLLNPQPQAYQDLNLQDYHANYFQQGNHVLIDVRTVEEFRDTHLPGAINIPLHLLPQRLDKIPTGQPIVVICATGNRSRSGAEIIKRAGHDTVFNLQGGTFGWQMRGLPTER